MVTMMSSWLRSTKEAFSTVPRLKVTAESHRNGLILNCIHSLIVTSLALDEGFHYWLPSAHMYT